VVKAHSTSRFAFAGGLALVIALLAVLTLRVAGNHKGLRHFAHELADAPAAKLEWLADSTGRMSVTDVAARPSTEWHAWDGKHYLIAGRGETLWLRITLHNADSQPLRAVLQETDYYMDRVEGWLLSAAPGDAERAPAPTWQPLGGGKAPQAWERPWWAWRAAFEVEVPPGQTRVTCVRLEDYYFPFTWWQWWPRKDDYVAAEFRELLVKTLCFGALTAMWLYNAVLWLRLRLPDVGYYVGYAAAMTGFNFLENGGLALVEDFVSPPWRPVLEVAALALAAHCITRFARLFLDTENRMPRFDRFLRRLGIAWVAVFCGSFTMPWTSLTFWLAIGVLGISATHLLLLGGAVVASRAGLRPARFFILAFGALCLGALPGSIVWGSGANTHPATIWLLAGSTLEMLLLSFAVADRFAQTQRRLVEETEQRRVIEEAYADELEIEVRERTRELQAANADKDRMLAVIGHDLRSPLTGLMRSADDATGEFARDTARTSRALLLMIEDLVLWARLRAGTRFMAMHRVSGIVEPALALHRSLAEHGGIDVRVEMPEELRVETDLVLAQTLVRNLLANALKFADARVVLRAVPDAPDGVRVTIANDGPPLAPEVAARFAAGEDEPMTATGGLGLRLCREICRALRTPLEAGNAADGGTEFAFTLKAVAEGTEKNL
jgi:signal transduction histidine kinase